MAILIDIFLICAISSAFAQTENSERLDSCNVVCNCNSGSPIEPLPQSHVGQGPPGKRGGKGDIGIPGEKGEKGEVGRRGEKGVEPEVISMPAILSAMSASSCQELKIKHGVNVNGYYPMRSPITSLIESRYCDFTPYSGAANCDELSEYNITLAGYYLFGSNTVTGKFEFCEPTVSDVYTCQAMAAKLPNFNRESGFYYFKSQQHGFFRVFCDFSQSPVVTEVHHTLMTSSIEIQPPCETRGCFGAIPSYDVAGSDLEKVIENSVSCKQFLKLKCRGVLIVRDGHSWWVSRNGEKMQYWGGARRNGYCACGETNSCIDNSWKCNCDQNSDSITTSDEGYLTDKSKLPIKEIRVGDHGDSGEAAWYTIGKLECAGQV